MKIKLCILSLVGLAAWSLAAYAQTTPAAGELPTPNASANNNSAAPDQGTAKDPAPPADATVAANTAPADAAAKPAAADATATTASADTNAPAADANATSASPPAPAPAQPGAIIPLIVMDDVPLTDAIKNLARQAGLNYMLDPKVAFGQAGPDGRPIPQPTVSIRWENVSAEQALNALLGNYNLQLVEDTKSKIARVTVKDPAAPDPLVTKVVQLKYSSPTNMMAAIQNTLTDKRSKVVPDNRTSQLVVLATEKEVLAVDELVERLDTRTKQVLIESRLMETQMNPSSSHGVDWSGTLANQHVAFGNGTMTGTSVTKTPGDTGTTTTLPSGRTISSSGGGSSTATVLNSIIGSGGLGLDTSRGFTPNTFFLNADGASAVLSFLNTYAQTKVLSTPRTVTLDNETSVIEVGTLYPIVNTTAGTANTTGGSQVTYSNLTVRLEVTPRISANNYINLKVTPTVLRLGDSVKSVVGGVANSVNSFNTRVLRTSVMIPSGDTLVMGGLIEDNIHQENVKVPVLGDLPGIGLLFRYDLKQRQKSNLVVFLTPTIVGDDDFQQIKSDYLKTPAPTKDYLEDDWSDFDSGKPRDWSNVNTKENISGKFDESLVQPKASVVSKDSAVQ